MNSDNIRPPQVFGAAPAANGATAVAPAPAPRPAAGNLSTDEPAGASLLDALKQSQDQLKTVLTGVDNQATVQTVLQVQANLQQMHVQPDLQATFNKQAAEARNAAIAKV